MFVFSFKSTKLKLGLLVALVVIAALVLFWVAGRDSNVLSDPTVNYSAKNAEERLAFLAQFGWEVGEDPIEVAEVVIPAEFDNVYSQYNEIQTEQNLDLKPYANARVKRWTYSVKNYPGVDDNAGIRANLLVYEGRVIGGDICSVALDGFMHGFLNEDVAPAKNTKAETTKAEATKEKPQTTKEAATKQEATKQETTKAPATKEATTLAPETTTQKGKSTKEATTAKSNKIKSNKQEEKQKEVQTTKW
ncbi:MAG: DUF4830 domain-containing protein [Oscillospiraceae bacterium]|jgi:hypothetical protein|nr:DUF4830 domain-containing protein [Oscillospiraceae bacterium]